MTCGWRGCATLCAVVLYRVAAGGCTLYASLYSMRCVLLVLENALYMLKLPEGAYGINYVVSYILVEYLVGDDMPCRIPMLLRHTR